MGAGNILRVVREWVGWFFPPDAREYLSADNAPSRWEGVFVVWANHVTLYRRYNE